jgi:hypothetical protein
LPVQLLLLPLPVHEHELASALATLLQLHDDDPAQNGSVLPVAMLSKQPL